MIRDLPRLRQLDTFEVTRQDKIDVGLELSDEEEEVEDTDDKKDAHRKTGLDN